MTAARCALALGLAALALIARAEAQVVTVATNPQGSLFYTAGTAIAKVMDDTLKVQARVQPTAGSSTYVPLLDRNEVEFGVTNVDDTVTAVKGIDAFAGKPNPNLRVVAIIFPLPLTVVVPADSPARTIAETKGLRYPSGYAGQSTVRKLQDALLANAGLAPDDVRGVPVVHAFAGVDAMAAGRTDAAVIGPGTPQVQKAHADLAARGGVRFLSIDTSAAAVARMKTVFPGYPMEVQPAPHLPGVVGPTWVMGYSIYLTSNSAVPDDLVYRVAKMLHENRDALVAITPVLSRFDPKRMTEKVDAEFHAGAIRFYREIGQWPPRD